MPAKVCPSCGLVNPSKSMRCDCGYQFESVREERRTCPDCDSVWTYATPRCSCGAWLDDEARRANVMFGDLLAKGWVALVSGILVVVVPLLIPPLRMLGIGRLSIVWAIIAGALILKGMHAIAYARNGLRRHALPRRGRAARPPEARVVRRSDGAPRR
ncbi:MAG TPA: hypothetical protein VNO30_15065 [Kofleriaceae bacterium]|nr:hypothetical protein [Kofleriaceae bacterium]